MSEWIPVSERLPDDGLVLVHAETADEESPLIHLAWHRLGDGWSLFPKHLIPGITHWMPLPDPPQADQ